MKYLFEYNWIIRNEWFDLLMEVSKEELTKSRIGGPGTILETLFHIIKVEHNWICDLKDSPISPITFESLQNQLSNIRELSEIFHRDVREFIEAWDEKQEFKVLHLIVGDGREIKCTYGEALRHIIAHEIHHIGQISIWAREIGLVPVSSNLIHKGIMLK